MQDNNAVIPVYSTDNVTSVEICGKVGGLDFSRQDGAWVNPGAGTATSWKKKPDAVGACSACGGDYEDPDRTAWPLEEGDESDDEDGPVALTEEFPAER